MRQVVVVVVVCVVMVGIGCVVLGCASWLQSVVVGGCWVWVVVVGGGERGAVATGMAMLDVSGRW